MKKQIEQRAKSKTYWLGFAVMLLGYLQQNFSLIDKYLGDSRDIAFFAVGFLILVLRELTKTPISEKGKPP